DPAVVGKVDVLPGCCTDGLGPHRSHTLNYSRVLLHHGLVFEDDVSFCPEWDLWLSRSCDECRGLRQDGRFALALYSCYPWDAGRLVTPYPVDWFYGLQGMYFAAAVRTPLYLYLLAHFGREPTDLLLKGFCREQGVSLLACAQSLVQHV